MKSKRLVRLFGLVAILAMLVQPMSSFSVTAQEASPLGSLQVSLTDEAGSPIGGGCFIITDANGVAQSLCDDDGDGFISVPGLPIGGVTVEMTSAPVGYSLAAAGQGEIIEGQLTAVDLVSAVIPAEPTEAPTREPAPTNAPTEEPALTETATATSEPTSTPTEGPAATSAARGADFSAAAAGEFTVSCTYDSSTNLSTFGLVVQKLNPNDPDPDPNLIITIEPFDNNMVPLDPIIYHSYDSGTQFQNMP